MAPAIEHLMDRTRSKFSLVTLAAKRAREITEYFGNLKTSEVVGPTVETVSTKHLSVAFEEIAATRCASCPRPSKKFGPRSPKHSAWPMKRMRSPPAKPPRRPPSR